MDAPPRVTDLLVPTGTRVLHVGAQKTGTTAIQASLVAARDGLPAQGVRVIGRERQPDHAVLAVLGRPTATGAPPPSPSLWDQLVGRFGTAAEPRTILSEENLSFADPATIARIVRDLDPERVRVVVTLRHIGRILPSHWQQSVQVGITDDLDAWLHAVFDRFGGPKPHPFWIGQRQDVLVAGWAEAVGADRVTVVVVDEGDRGRLYRTFEDLLGLDVGALPEIRDRANRSLTLPEAEAVRAFDVAALEAGVTRRVHARAMRFGAADGLERRTPPATEPRVELPAWAAEPAQALAVEMVDAIVASGVRIVGDVETLRSPIAGNAPTWAGDDRGGPIAVPPEVAALLALGVLRSAGPEWATMPGGHAPIPRRVVRRLGRMVGLGQDRQSR